MQSIPPHATSPPPISWRMQAVLAFLCLSQRKHMYTSAARLHAMLRNGVTAAPAPPSDEQMHVQALDAPEGWSCWRLSPAEQIPTPERAWLYLHGGAYVRPITAWHWRLLRRLVAESGCTIIVPQYPLAPASTCANTIPCLQQAVQAWMAPYAQYSVMGDSAGGGMAVALSLAQHDTSERMAQQLLLITPWLDLTMDDDACANIARSDPMLALGGAREAGLLYAGNLPTHHPWCSPVMADPHGLPPIQMWCAERDICTPAALRFAERVRQANGHITVHHGLGMPHVWPLLPAPEGWAARWELVQAIHAR